MMTESDRKWSKKILSLRVPKLKKRLVIRIAVKHYG
jgi:hypothetical protein